MLNSFCMRQWQMEAVVYHLPTGNMYLLPSSHADILVAINKDSQWSALIERIRLDFQLDEQEANQFLNDLYTEYRKINLIT